MSSRFETLLNTKKCPWLLYNHGNRNRPKQTLFSLTEGRYYETSLPIMSDMLTWACSYGWILMLDKHSDDCILFNPVSMARMKLPDWASGYRIRSCNLFLPPDDPNCIFLAFYWKPRPGIRLWKPGDAEWTDHELDSEDKLPRCLVPIGGKFYGLAKSPTTLMVLEYDGCSVRMRPDEEGAIEVPWFLMPGNSMYQRHLLESGGELFIVDITFFGLIQDRIRYIEVHKFDMYKLTWEKVENLGDRAFFISTRAFGTSCSASRFGIKENCIYCALAGEKSLFIFDMEDLSITTILPCPERFKGWGNNHWVIPP